MVGVIGLSNIIDIQTTIIESSVEIGTCQRTDEGDITFFANNKSNGIIYALYLGSTGGQSFNRNSTGFIYFIENQNKVRHYTPSNSGTYFMNRSGSGVEIINTGFQITIKGDFAPADNYQYRYIVW